MADEITFEQPQQEPESSRSALRKERVTGKPSEGRIAKEIGSGDNAKNSFIWITIRYSFVIASVITLAIYLRPTYCQSELATNLIEDIKATWSIFMPVITLALGYTFGKGR